MDLKKAYRQMMDRKDIATVLGLKPNYVYAHRYDLSMDKYPTMDLMEERLLKAGYVKIFEAVWLGDGDPEQAHKKLSVTHHAMGTFLKILGSANSIVEAVKKFKKK